MTEAMNSICLLYIPVLDAQAGPLAVARSPGDGGNRPCTARIPASRVNRKKMLGANIHARLVSAENVPKLEIQEL